MQNTPPPDIEINAPVEPADAKLASLSGTGRVLKVLSYVLAGLFAGIALLLTVQLFAGAVQASDGPSDVIGSSVAAVLSIAEFYIFAIVFLLAAFMFKDISQGESPFSRKHARRIKVIAWLLLAHALLDSFLPRGVTFGDGASGGAPSVIRPDSEYSVVNIGAFAIAVIFFFLSSVFEYGVELQELSDETI